MSQPNDILQTLREAFKEMDNTHHEIPQNSPYLPKPIPATTMLEKVKNLQSSDTETSNVTAFPKFCSPSADLQMAAREGKEITSDVLDKMRMNREKSE